MKSLGLPTPTRGISEASFNEKKVQLYNKALRDLDATQSALVMRSQGFTNAQIQQVLATKKNTETHQKLTIAEQHQAMADAGLLKSKRTLTAAEVKENLQTVMGKKANVEETMSSIGLKIATDAEGKEVVQLTKAKLVEAVERGKLTAADLIDLKISVSVKVDLLYTYTENK